MDTRLRALERAAASDGPLARHRFAVELERTGALDELDRSLEALLGAIQPADAVWPTTSKLDAAALATAVQEVATSSTPTWRLLVADHHFRSPTASPEGTYAAVVAHDDLITIGAERGDTRRAARVRADLTPTSEPLKALAILGGPARQSVLRVSRAVGAEWARRRLRRARVEGFEHVRLRPAMYVGDTRERGAQALADELLDRAVELFSEGRCRGVRVRHSADGACSVEDDGPGVSTALDDLTGAPVLEAVLTGLARNDGSTTTYPVAGGLHGLDLWVVNALSAWLEVESRHGGLVVRQRFERGHPVAPSTVVGSTDRTGLTVTFLPDPTIFRPPVTIGFEWLSQRLRELSFVNRGFKATLEQVDSSRAETHVAEQGVVDALLAMVANDAPLLANPLVIRGSEAAAPDERPVIIEAALTWTRHQGATIVDYANSVLLREGGPHLTALRAAVTRILSPLGGARRGVDYCEGLVAFVSMKVPDPQFEGCTRSKLANPEVGPIMGRLVTRALAGLLAERPREAKAIVSQALARSKRKKLPRAGVKRAPKR